MRKIGVDESSSDSSVGSWTLLDEEANASEFSSSEDEVERNRANGFLTFDEFFQERLFEHDYDEAPKKLKQIFTNKKEARKCKAQNWSIKIFLALVVAMTALATLTSSISQPIEEPKLRKTNDSLYQAQVLKEINKTIREIQNVTEKFSNNSKECPNPNFGPQLKPTSFIPKETPTPSAKPEKPKTSFVKALLKSSRINVEGKRKWSVIKDILLNTNMHTLVSLVITNAYLLTLLVNIAKRQKLKINPKEIITEEDVRRFLFAQLPFASKKSKSKRSRKLPHLTSITTTTSIPQERPSSHFGKFLEASEELGKSECERRFEELDKYQRKCEKFRQAQRNRIKLLKQKFRNEVSFIRETEEESDARADKINRTSQKFIRKMKFNREKYLLELKKIKEAKQNVSTCKEASVGNYTATIPSCFDFGFKVKTIKARFEDGKELVPFKPKFQ